MDDRVPHVLIVDDDPAIREALDAALSGSYVVHTVASGKEACLLLRTHPIAAIILDAVLGDEDGLELIESFQALSAAPILILTGYGSEELAIRALRLNASDYLKKPVNLHELHARLARWVPRGVAASDPVEWARLLLDEHLGKEFDGKDLAGQVGLSERHLRRRFRQAHAVTPRQYVIEARMEWAAGVLRIEGSSVKQAATDLGYKDPRRFGRLFKRRFGLSPSAFRQ